MGGLYFGKFSRKYPQQIEEKFYAGGEHGSVYYGGIEPGDYVFPIFEGQVIGLWKVTKYGEKKNKINKKNSVVVFFEEVKQFEEPIRYQNKFARYRYFELDLNTLNKAIKSHKSGFVPVETSSQCPDPKDINIEGNLRNFYIMLKDQEDVFFEDEQKSFKEEDIRILINNFNETKILSMQIYKNGKFVTYDLLDNLYKDRNPEEERYTIKELLKYAKLDNAPRKEKYLRILLDDLKEQGYYIEYNPIFLYDNLIVGRKKTGNQKSSGSEEDNEEAAPMETNDSLEELLLYEKYSELLKFNPNLILYGPPGTGKTYATQKIVESFEMNFNDGLYKSFSEIESEKRVKFVTFHQAYSYEEFIEGIRPQLESDESKNNDSSDITYKIQDGIIKQLANSASMQYIKQSEVQDSGIEMLSEASRIWKVSLGRTDEKNIYKDCKDNNEVAIGWLKERSLEGKTHDDIYNLLLKKRDEKDEKPKHDAHCIDSFVNEMSTGDIVFILNSHETIRDIGIITSDYYYNKDKLNLYPHRRKVKWLKEYDNPINIYSYNGNTRLTSKTIYELSRIDFSDLKSLLEIEDLELENDNDNINRIPYYLIIDEINRGNIAKIFGELITLIEKDKREELSITLPYSKKSFELPSNIYIIGTMNTADRSIAIIDTALRRRFTFAEVEPDIKVFNLPNENGVINDTIDLPKLLTKLNVKIIDMLDREHRIGHSYFMGLLNLKDFYNTWYYKIIPLLMEYFYNDLSAIKDIIGSSFLKDHGGIKFLSMESKGDNNSQFEEAIISIYTGQN